LLAAIVGLTRFASNESQLHQNLADDCPPGAGLIVRSELLCVWLPETLVDLAKQRGQARTASKARAARRRDGTA
jgi:hypothetical protein